MVNRLLVALHCVSNWTLHAPVQPVQDLPDVARMIVDSTFLLDQVGNPRQGPEARFVTDSFRASLQRLFDFDQVLVRQPSLATAAAGCPQAFDSLRFERGCPPTNRLPVHTNFPRHVGLAPTLLEQLCRLQTPAFQGFEVAFHSPWVSHKGTVHEK